MRTLEYSVDYEEGGGEEECVGEYCSNAGGEDAQGGGGEEVEGVDEC